MGNPDRKRTRDRPGWCGRVPPRPGVPAGRSPSWGITAAAGALHLLLAAWSGPCSIPTAPSAAVGMEQGAQRMPYLLAGGIGTLSWLAGVVIVATLLARFARQYGPIE